MQVTVFLVDNLGATAVNTCRADILTRVNALYKDCFAFANAKKPKGGPHTFSVQFVTAKPAPANTDLVVYFVPALAYSVIIFSETRSKQSPLLNDHWGLTRLTPGQGALPHSSKSEVICRSTDGAVLGSLVFHEILHAKTNKDNNKLHPSEGLGAAVVEGTTALNNINRTDIASTITTPVVQWADGWDILEDARRQRDAGDDTWNLF